MINSKALILTGWCSDAPKVRQEIFRSLASQMNEDPMWLHVVDALDVPRLKRIVNQNRLSDPLDWSRFEEKSGVILWDGEEIGRIHIAWKSALPAEAQTKIAYEIFYDRFILFAQKSYHAVVLHQNEGCLQLFIPNDIQLDEIWSKYVESAFSVKGLSQTFVKLVNNIELTGRGFSAINTPIVTPAQAITLSAFNLANIQSLQRGDKNRQRKIEHLNLQLTTNTDEKEAEKITKNIATIQKEKDNLFQRYSPMYSEVDRIFLDYPDWMSRVRMVASSFTKIAGSQLMTQANVVNITVQKIREYAQIEEEDYYKLAQLISATVPQHSHRSAGDSDTKFCYGCGSLIKKGSTKYEANKFIFSSPSQRLQSGAGQSQPRICGTCAAVSFVSPIKVTGNGLIVRLSRRGNMQSAIDLADNQLRFFRMDELNIVAGRYVLLKADEEIGKDKVMSKLGGRQYALYRVASSFLPQVFNEHEVRVTVKGAEFELHNAQLIWMSQLVNIFNLKRKWHDKGKFMAFGRAIRHIEKEEIIFAIYTLMRSELIQNFSLERLVWLENLRKSVTETESEMKDKQMYEDIAGLTGLLMGFCDFVRNRLRKAGKNSSEINRSISKVIEDSKNAEPVAYTIAKHTESVHAQLWFKPENYFVYGCLHQLLQNMGVDDAKQREIIDEKGQRIQLYIDDIAHAYAYIAGKYPTEQKWRDLTYQLKLSLYSRYPDLLKSSNDKENS